MNAREFEKMREEAKIREALMSDEEKMALEKARRRHSEKVRSEILTSFVLDEVRKSKKKDEEE